MLKKVLCIVFALCAIVSVFSGCTDDETVVEESYYEVNDKDVVIGDTITNTDSNTNTTVNKTERPKEVGDSEYSFDISEVEIPKRKLKNKKITYYGWQKLSTDKTSTATLMKKEYGVTIENVIVNQEGYWDTLATMIAAGKSPDLVETSSWDYYPAPISLGLLQPLDNILNLEDKLWEDTYAFNNEIAWNGKHYFVYNDAAIGSWLFYNTKMFKNFGVKKTPKDYFLEDNWTWDTLKELADKFVTYNSDGSIKTTGFTMGHEELALTTGVELISRDSLGKFTCNLNDPKITKFMNYVHSMGKAGSNGLAFIGDRGAAFANGEVAMLTWDFYSITDERWKGIRKDIEWVPMPKMDASSDYYMSVWTMPEPCIPVGAKNVEGAALYIEFNKWKNLGWRTSTFLPHRTNAAMKKYKLKDFSMADKFTAEELKWTEQILSKYTYKYMTNIWQSWVYNVEDATYPGTYPGVNYVIEGKAWSTVYNEIKPKYDALLSKYNK